MKANARIEGIPAWKRSAVETQFPVAYFWKEPSKWHFRFQCRHSHGLFGVFS